MRPENARGLTRRSFLEHSAAYAAGGPGVLAFAQSAVASESTAPQDNWPDFRNGPTLHGVASTELPEKPRLLWEREAPDGCKSTPAIVEGRVYVGTLSGELHCLSLETGDVHWTRKSRDVENPKSFVPGFSSPVTVHADSVLCGDEEGLLHCLDRANGTPRWTFNADGLIVGSAAVRGERVIVGAHSQFLYGVDLKSGQKLWEFDAKGPINGSQAFDGDMTFVTGCSEPVLYVVDTRTGEEHARVPLDDLLIATPALADGLLYFGTSEGQVQAVDWKAKSTIWKFETRQPREVHSAPAITANHVIIGARDKSLYCLDRKNGELRWIFKTRNGNDNSPVVVGDRVFFGSEDKSVYAVTLQEGTEAWKFNAGVAFSESSPAVAQKRLVICTNGPAGRILCFG